VKEEEILEPALATYTEPAVEEEPPVFMFISLESIPSYWAFKTPEKVLA